MAPRLVRGPPSISHIHRNIWCSTCIINTTISDYGLNLWRLCGTTRFVSEIFKCIHKQIDLLRKNAQEMQVIGKTKSTLQERARNDLGRQLQEVSSRKLLPGNRGMWQSPNASASATFYLSPCIWKRLIDSFELLTA